MVTTSISKKPVTGNFQSVLMNHKENILVFVDGYSIFAKAGPRLV